MCFLSSALIKREEKANQGNAKNFDVEEYVHDFETYLNSEFVKNTSNDLALADLSNLLTMQEFIQKRDFLITHLVINNIRRSLEMCSFTLKEFADAKRDKDGEGFAICIKYHKTRSNGKSYNCK